MSDVTTEYQRGYNKAAGKSAARGQELLADVDTRLARQWSRELCAYQQGMRKAVAEANGSIFQEVARV